MAGRLQDAQAYAEDALARARGQERPHLEAQALRQLGLARARLGNTEAGRTDLSRSLEMFEHLGAEPFARQVRDDLRSLEDRSARGSERD